MASAGHVSSSPLYTSVTGRIARGNTLFRTRPLCRRIDLPPSAIEMRVKLKKNTLLMITVMYDVELPPPVPPRMTTKRK